MLFRSLTLAAFISFLFLIANMAFQTAVGQFFAIAISHIPYGDKVVHFFLMAVFSFLLNGSLNKKQLQWAGQQWLVGSLLVTLFITLEECSQAFIPARHFEIMDLVCNYAGIYAGGLLFLILLPGLGQQTTGKANERNATFSLQTVFHRTR